MLATRPPSSSSPSLSPTPSAPSSPAPARQRADSKNAADKDASSSSPLIPRNAIYLSDKEIVGEDVLGEAWKATIKGSLATQTNTTEVVAQRLVIHDDEEELFSQELYRCVGELAYPGLLPVIGASKEVNITEEHTVNYLLISKKSEMTADQLLKQKREENPTVDMRIAWALSIAQALQFLYSKVDNYQHGQVNLRHVHLDLKTQEAWLACWAFRSFRANRRARPPTLSDFYWKAPEVLLREKRRGSVASADEDDAESDPSRAAQAADVYSFGILLWELYSLKQAFTDYKSLSTLIDGVSVQKHRPAITEDWPESLGILASKCWNSSVEARPTFAEVTARLQDVFLEVAIQDGLAREFWSTRFAGKTEIDFSVFQPSFYQFLGLPEPKKNDIKCNCLRAILRELHEQNKDSVTVKTFSDMMQWFGPLEKGWSLLDRVNELCAKPWFFGRISGKDAEEAVCKADKGAFLFRFSTSKPGSYAITVHSRRGGAKHFRVYHEPRLNYLIGKTECKSLDEIIFKFKADLNLVSPCPGSQFLELFRQDNFLKARYDSWETEEDEDQDSDIW